MTNINAYILAQDDPFEFIYEGISGHHGTETFDYLNDMYNQIAIDYYLHPDDDFEKIIEHMLYIMEEDQ